MDLMFWFLVAIGALTSVEAELYDYYWRDYDGDIPGDAIPGGLDANNMTTYIAQAYVPGQGLIPTRLYRGSKSVVAYKSNLYFVDKFIKILCTNHPENFSWKPATSANLQNVTREEKAVVGGTENGGVLFIGRIPFEGEVIVGKVASYNVGFALVYFPYNNTEVHSTRYEVLVVNSNGRKCGYYRNFR